MVLVMSALSFLTRYPPASSGPWLRGVMACQGGNWRLVRDCPASIDAQMERKVQRVEGDGGENASWTSPSGHHWVLWQRCRCCLGLLGTARSENAIKGADGEGSIMNRDMRGTAGCYALIDVAANNLSLLATISLVFLYKILYVPRWIPPPIVRDLELH